MVLLDPEVVENFTLQLGQTSEIGLGLSLAAMMFAVALGLRPAHFSFFRSAPRAFIVGFLGQLIALPLLTLALCYLLNPLPSIALGMILISCCPGGNVSNMLVLLGRGNVALSVSLTAASSVTAAFITPLAIVFWSGLYPPTSSLLTSIDLDTTRFLIQTASILAAPLLTGMLVKFFFPELAERCRGVLLSISGLCLLVIILVGAAQYFDELFLIGSALIGLVALHNACAFAAGNLLARAARLNNKAQRTLTFELGIQNSGLGIVILLTQLGGLGGAAAVAGLWGLWHILAGLVVAMLFRASDRAH